MNPLRTRAQRYNSELFQLHGLEAKLFKMFSHLMTSKEKETLEISFEVLKETLFQDYKRDKAKILNIPISQVVVEHRDRPHYTRKWP